MDLFFCSYNLTYLNISYLKNIIPKPHNSDGDGDGDSDSDSDGNDDGDIWICSFKSHNFRTINHVRSNSC